jgi:hypothetical protein
MGLSGKLLIDCPNRNLRNPPVLIFVLPKPSELVFGRKKRENPEKMQNARKKEKRKTTWKTNETNQRWKLKVLKR